MMNRNWLRSLELGRSSRIRRTTSTRRRRRNVRPSLHPVFDRLEDRTLLSSFTLNTTVDTVDANPGDGLAEDASGNTSLRAAIMEANALPGDDTIVLGAGVFVLSLPGRSENTGATGDLDVTDTSGALSLVGAGIGLTTVDAAGIDRVFEVRPGAALQISGITVTGGKVGVTNQFEGGGGIVSSGDLTVSESEVVGNSAVGDFSTAGGIYGAAGTTRILHSRVTDNFAAQEGGGFRNDATLFIEDSVVSNNDSGRFGGGIFSLGSGFTGLPRFVTVERSTISDNEALVAGGGLYVIGTDFVRITDSTFSGNRAPSGGAVQAQLTSVEVVNSTVTGNYADVGAGLDFSQSSRTVGTITHSTIAHNVATLRAGGVRADGGELVTLANTIVANNVSSADPDLSGAFLDAGYNLIGNIANATGLVNGVNGDMVGSPGNPIAPLLGPLQNNGGATQTHALLAGSPAIDAGDPDFTPPPDFDQRGAGFPRVHNGRIDIGAYEDAGISNRPPVADAGPDQAAVEGDLVTLDGSVTDPDPGDTHTFLWQVTTDNAQIVADGTAEDFSFTPLDDGVYTITFRATDAEGAFDTALVTVTVDNAAPTITALHSSNADLASKSLDGIVTIDGTFFDPAGDFDTHTVTVDWGDGTGEETLTSVDQSGDAFDGEHTYTSGGIFTILVTVTDDDGGAVSETTRAVVVGIGLNDGVLQVVGTDLSEKITIRPLPGDPSWLLVKIRERGTGVVRYQVFSAAAVDSIHILGNGGHDLIVVASSLYFPTLLEGGDGNDFVFGGSGNDAIHGGAGNDRLFGRRGVDTVFGELGDDLIWGSHGNDVLDGGDGDDVIWGMYGDDQIFGGDGHDLLLGGHGDDIMEGGEGNDLLWGGAGDDTLSGGDGNDILLGGLGNDTLAGEEGDDFLFGGPGNDSLDGGEGLDLLFDDWGWLWE